jgi:hypothetical protein
MVNLDDALVDFSKVTTPTVSVAHNIDPNKNAYSQDQSQGKIAFVKHPRIKQPIKAPGPGNIVIFNQNNYKLQINSPASKAP